MLKIKELLNDLIKTQKQINQSIKELKETSNRKSKELSTTLRRMDSLENTITTNMYSKEETIEAINKEMDYNRKLEKIQRECPDLLDFIATISTGYANMDKYNILATTEMFSFEYEKKKKRGKI